MNHMAKDYSHQNLQKAVFRGEDLRTAIFSGSDLRGADFTGANLAGADLREIKTGITPLNTLWIFFIAVMVSLTSGYFAMLTGRTIQLMLASDNVQIRYSGIIAAVLIILFILYALWKGGSNAIRHLILPAMMLALFVGLIAYFSGLGTGRGMFYLIISFFFLLLMFIIGTVARAAAGTLSNILLSGGMFGKSLGGGLAAVIMAIACAIISKKALSGAEGFGFLQKIASSITARLGTSFRNSRLNGADFSGAVIRNSDFANADITDIHWGNSTKINCLINEKLTTEKKGSTGKKRDPSVKH